MKSSSVHVQQQLRITSHSYSLQTYHCKHIDKSDPR